MSESDLLAIGLLLLLWLWLPSARLPAWPNRGQQPDEQTWWTNLSSTLVVSRDLSQAVQRCGDIPDQLSSSEKLHSLMKLNSEDGVAVANLVGFLQRDVRLRVSRMQLWRERSSAAVSASSILALLPLVSLSLSASAGLAVWDFLFRQPVGWLLLVMYIGLTSLARFWVRKLRQFAIGGTAVRSSTADEAKSRSRAIPTISGWMAAVLVASLAFSVRHDFVGAVLSILLARVVQAWWVTLQNRSGLVSEQAQLLDRPWLVALLAANLLSGLDWQRSVQLAAANCTAQTKLEFDPVLQRLNWGVAPAEAFVQLSAIWQPIGVAISQAMEVGAPIADGLRKLSDHWQQELHSEQVSKIERIATRAILPVALFQLPAFLLVGVLPMLITSLQPMWTQLVTNGNPFG